MSYFEKDITRIIAGEAGYSGEKLDTLLHTFEQEVLIHSREFWTSGGVVSDNERTFESFNHGELKEHLGLLSLYK